MRVAVTGASGFIGGAVARALADMGHTVLAYGRRPLAALPRPLPNYTIWDITTGPIDAPAADAVVHCAARVDQWGSAAAFHAVNVDGTRHVLTTFAHARRFVHVSTASVYDERNARVAIREDAPATGICFGAYARSKTEAERVVLASGRAVVILRPHIVYGPGDTTLMPRVLAARRFGWLPVPGNGRHRISITHINNLVSSIERALAGSVMNGVFNIADATDVRLDDLLRTMLRRHGVPDRIVYIPRAVAWAIASVSERLHVLLDASRPPVLTRFVVSHLADDFTLDLTRARTELGYAPCWSYRDDPAAMAS